MPRYPDGRERLLLLAVQCIPESSRSVQAVCDAALKLEAFISGTPPTVDSETKRSTKTQGSGPPRARRNTWPKAALTVVRRDFPRGVTFPELAASLRPIMGDVTEKAIANVAYRNGLKRNPARKSA